MQDIGTHLLGSAGKPSHRLDTVIMYARQDGIMRLLVLNRMTRFAYHETRHSCECFSWIMGTLHAIGSLTEYTPLELLEVNIGTALHDRARVLDQCLIRELRRYSFTSRLLRRASIDRN